MKTTQTPCRECRILYGVLTTLLIFSIAAWLILIATPVAGATPRPKTPPTVVTVTITAVTVHSEGLYLVTLDDGRVLLISPTTRKTPAPQPGVALLSSTRLTQDGAIYRRIAKKK